MWWVGVDCFKARSTTVSRMVNGIGNMCIL